MAQGNHKVEGAELGERLDDGSIEILHFPMRTYAQFENKIVKGGRAYARNRELPQRTGRTWRRLYEAWEQGRLRDHYDEQRRRRARGRPTCSRTRACGTSCASSGPGPPPASRLPRQLRHRPALWPSPKRLVHSDRSTSGHSSASRSASSR